MSRLVLRLQGWIDALEHNRFRVTMAIKEFGGKWKLEKAISRQLSHGSGKDWISFLCVDDCTFLGMPRNLNMVTMEIDAD
jgi:hypothetical protein